MKLHQTLESQGKWTNIWILVGALLLARAAFIAILPEMSTSWDMRSWIHIATKLMPAGRNQYTELHALNWPPFWLMVIAAVSHVTTWTGIPAVGLFRGILIGSECLVLIVTYLLMEELGVRQKMRVLLYGIALNPICIYLNCVHGNFDVIVALSAILFALATVRFAKGGHSEQWLLACLWLGMGIFVKTIPLILAPILLMGIQRVRKIERWIGAALVIGPAAIGVGTLYALFPAEVMKDILLYRSTSGGLFGWTGIAYLATCDLTIQWAYLPESMLRLASHIFIASTALLFAVEAWWIRKMENHSPMIVAPLVLFNLLLIPVMGPGLSSQYIFWYIPLACVVFAIGIARKEILLCFSVCIPIWTLIYATFPNFGQFAVRAFPIPPPFLFDVLDQGKIWSRDWHFRVLMIPVFLALVALWIRLLIGIRFRMVAGLRGKETA